MKFKLIYFVILFITGLTPDASSSDSDEALIVLSGAGMRQPLEKIGEIFEKTEGIRVYFDFGGSGHLGNKILAGQEVDIFIPGDETWANLLLEKGFVKYYIKFAKHVPVIITPLSDVRVNTLTDFTLTDVHLVLGDSKACAIGKVTDELFITTGLKRTDMQIDAIGLNVKQLIQWIETGNADASLVWMADAFQSKKLRIVTIPENMNKISIIPLCQMNQSKSQKHSKTFIDFICNKGKTIFEENGFSTIA